MKTEKLDAGERTLPPTRFTNVMADLNLTYDLATYRQTQEWKVYVAGYNAAVEACNDSIKAKYNMGQIADKLFR